MPEAPGAGPAVLPGPSPAAPGHPPADPFAPRVCEACAHANPPAARYCNQCGSALGSAARGAAGPLEDRAAAPTRGIAAPAASADRPASDVGRRAFVLVGAGLAVVLLLFAVSTWSSSRVTSGSTDGPLARAPAPPPAAPTQPLPDSLRALVQAYEAEGSPEALFEAGRIYLTAAFDAPQEADRPGWARQALEAFERSLAQAPSSDVRVALAEAARMGGDPSNPMRAVEELQRVLEDDPDHVGANFVMADLRATIGRLDGAEELFERVIALTPPSDPVHQRALQNLAAVREARQGGGR